MKKEKCAKCEKKGFVKITALRGMAQVKCRECKHLMRTFSLMPDREALALIGKILIKA